ncbi:MAG: hypothetical protein ACI81P_000798 [Neolewinella sp.]|jgi:hypothetical protein
MLSPFRYFYIFARPETKIIYRSYFDAGTIVWLLLPRKGLSSSNKIG